jgi:exodeoxyribonuclease VII small subunit
MAEKNKSADIVQMSFEEALAELEKIVNRLEAGKGQLDEAIDAYTRGAQLKEHCEKKLREAKARVDSIRVGPGGAEGMEPAHLD